MQKELNYRRGLYSQTFRKYTCNRRNKVSKRCDSKPGYIIFSAYFLYSLNKAVILIGKIFASDLTED